MMQRFLRPAMHPPIRLRIADDALEADLDLADDRLLEDAGGPPIARHRLYRSGKDLRDDGFHGAILRLRPEAVKPNLRLRSEEHTSELQSLMRISYAVFCLTKKNRNT